MPSPTAPRRFGDLAPSRYPGERLGAPESGPGSVGRPGRRILALLIDWAIGSLLSFAFFRYDSWATLGIFAVLQYLFIPTIGGSPGHRLVGMRLLRVQGGWVGLWRPLVRTALLFLIVPALIWDADQRGLHDKAAGTVLVRA